jgi:hypothetical protein
MKTRDRESSAKRRFQALSLPKRVLGGIVAAAAAIGALAGAVTAFSESVNWWQRQHAETTQFDRTPQTGLEFWQGEEARAMAYRDDTQVVRVSMQPGPFEMRVPTVGTDTAVQLCAWSDDSVFRLREGMSVDDVPFFHPGTGSADTDYTSGRLILSDEAHNYLVGTRLRQISDQQQQVFFSRVDPDGQGPRPLGSQKSSLFLVVYIDRNENAALDLGEYEYVELQFD